MNKTDFTKPVQVLCVGNWVDATVRILKGREDVLLIWELNGKELYSSFFNNSTIVRNTPQQAV